MTRESPLAAFSDTSAQDQARSTGKRFERRCSTRPRFVESWRKTIKPEGRQGAAEDAVGNKLRVDVWIARTQTLLKARSSHAILTDDDWSGLAQLQTRSARDCAVATKLLLRLGLTQTVERGIGPREWRFQTTLLGRPMISNLGTSINFSISHTDALVVVAVSPQLNLGIDVESVDQDLPTNLIDGFCHVEEQKILQKLPQRHRARESVRLWTQKEAFTNYSVTGILSNSRRSNARPVRLICSGEQLGIPLFIWRAFTYQWIIAFITHRWRSINHVRTVDRLGSGSSILSTPTERATPLRT